MALSNLSATFHTTRIDHKKKFLSSKRSILATVFWITKAKHTMFTEVLTEDARASLAALGSSGILGLKKLISCYLYAKNKFFV